MPEKQWIVKIRTQQQEYQVRCDLAAAQVPCDTRYCGAKPGEPCRNDKGHDVTYFHWPRKRASKHLRVPPHSLMGQTIDLKAEFAKYKAGNATGKESIVPTDEKMVQAVMVRPEAESGWLTVGCVGNPITWQNFEAELVAAVDNDPNEVYEVRIEKMSQEAYDNLPEFDGW